MKKNTKNRYKSKYPTKMMYKLGSKRKGEFGSGKDAYTDEEWSTMSTIDKKRALGIYGGSGGRAGDYTGLRVSSAPEQKPRKRLFGLFKNGGINKYSTAGMYKDNTVSSAGQGTGSTANIVYEQSDPNILEQKRRRLEDLQTKLHASSDAMASDIQNQKDADAQKVVDVADASNQKSNLIDQSVASGVKGLKEAGEKGMLGEDVKQNLDKKSTGTVSALHAFKAQKAANLGTAATAGNEAGMNLITNVGAADKAMAALPEGAQIMSDAATGQTIVVDAAGNVIEGGASATGAGIAAAAKNPNVIAAAANVTGKVIGHFADDDDPTTWTFGEATGDVLGTAGEYAGYGATLGSVVPGVGNVVGAGVGAVIGTGKAIYTGLTGRNKARREKEELEKKRAAKVRAYNLDVQKQLTSAQTSARTAEIKAKTTSGYDLGRNVVAKYGGLYNYGGMKMGMPRYGYAA
jgi:hypothetical protein